MATVAGAQANSTIATDIGVMWKAAIEEYEKTTQVKVESLDRSNNVDQIVNRMQHRKQRFDMKRHDGSKLDRFRTLVKKSLGPISLLSNIVVQATKSVFPPCEAIFGAVQYLISVANAVSTGYDKVTRLFVDLDKYLHTLKVLEGDVPQVPELAYAISEVLTSILVLCGVYTKYVQTNRVVMTFRALFSEEDDELKDALDTFHDAIEKERRMVPYVLLSCHQHQSRKLNAIHDDVKIDITLAERVQMTAQSFQNEMANVNHSMQRRETEQERHQILEWLCASTFREKQCDILQQYCEGTGQWLLDTLEFQNWFSAPQPSVLWCPGIPGAGKTVMTSRAVEFVEENTSRSRVAMAYVYCNYKDAKTQSETDILRSIIRQLLENCKPLPQEIHTFREKFIAKTRLPTSDEWVSLVSSVLRCFEKTYVFIDALDECKEAARETLLRSLRKLEWNIRLFITSRLNIQLENKFEDLSRLEMEAHDSDLEKYIEFEMNKNGRLSELISNEPLLKAEIVQKVVQKAAGMFLLCHMQVLHLCGQNSVTSVRKSLDSMSTRLYDSYDDAMTRIANQSDSDKEIAKTALSYISSAKRVLDVEELRHLLSVDVGNTALDRHNFVSNAILLSISAGLIRIDTLSQTVTLVHYTLQEYLKIQSNQLAGDPDLKLALACFTYLSFDVFDHGPCHGARTLENRLREYRCLEYASKYWAEHVSNYQLHPEFQALVQFVKNERRVSSFLQVIYMPVHRNGDWYDCYPRDFSALHAIALWGLDEIVIAVLKDTVDVNIEDSHQSTPLQLAAQRGHSRVLQALIRGGADVNKINSRGETSIYWAARNGHLSIVQVLLSEGGDAMASDCDGWSALDWAVVRRYNDVVRLLSQHGRDEDLSARDDIRSKALILAAESGNENSLQLLIRSGADVNWKDKNGSAALHWAVPEGHMVNVYALLKDGADVNSTDIYANTPLHWATPHRSITQLLLDNGADIDATNDDGQTPLLWCAQDGQEQALLLLIENNADINIQDLHGFTALHASALKGYESIVEVLLTKGADPNVRDQDGWAPLHAAVLKSHSEILRLLESRTQNAAVEVADMKLRLKDPKERALLEHMAEIKSAGSTAITGLRWAVSEGHIARIETILDNGADIDAEDVGGLTALSIGAWMGQEVAVRVLLERGADANKPERSGRSALHIASEEGYLHVVQLLVDNGANIDASICGFTAILLAAKNGHKAVVHYLVREGADVSLGDYHGRTTLHWAAKFGPSTGLEVLIKRGADVNAVDRWGKTPLMWAIENRQTTVVDCLLHAAANPLCRAADASTALHFAAFVGGIDMIELLLKKGAQVDARTHDGFTALHMATFFGYGNVVRMLLECCY